MKRFLCLSWFILHFFPAENLFAQQWTILVVNEKGMVMNNAKLLGPLGEEYPVDGSGKAVYQKPWAPDITVKVASYRTQKVNLAVHPQNTTVTVRMQPLPPTYEPLHVYVYDKSTKKPVANASVTVMSGQSGTTNNEGHAIAGHRQLAGDYADIIVMAEGYKRYRGPVLIGETQRLQGSILTPGQKTYVYLEKGTNNYNVTAIIVEVLDDESNEPVYQASVTMTLSDNTEYKDQTNDKGEVRFSDTDIGFEGTRARVVVKHKEYAEKWSDITEDLTSSTSPDDRRFLVYIKRKDDWNGTFKDNYSTFIFTGGGGAVSANWTYTVSDSKGKGSLSSTKMEGNKVTGTWQVQHQDDTKTGARKGTFTLSLSGDTISGQLVEDTPSWNYKPGYSSDNVNSSMKKGAVWPVSVSRKN